MVTSPYNRRAVGTFPTREAAERALHELRDSGFPMEQVSVVAQEGEQDLAGRNSLAGADIRSADRRAAHTEHKASRRADREAGDKTDNKADDGAKVGAFSGGLLGGLTGLLVGLGTLAIPGVGPIMLAGAAATALATTAAGGAIGAAAGGLLGGLVGLGIPEDRARLYHDRISSGEYLVIVDGTEADIARAEAILSRRGIQEWQVYPLAVSASASTHAPISAPISTPVSAPTTVSADANLAPTADTVQLYEERLVVDKEREKTGEVAIGKRVETVTERVAVPLEKERLVIEHLPAQGQVTPGADAFQEAEVRVELFEETPEIRKQVVVREEVTIRKEVEQQTVDAAETLRREELAVETHGDSVVKTESDRFVDRNRP